MNRRLVETIRSMSADSELPKQFWLESLSSAKYLRNCSLANAVQDKIPYKAWTGNVPNVSHLPTLMYPKMKEASLIQRLEKAFFLDMDKE